MNNIDFYQTIDVRLPLPLMTLNERSLESEVRIGDEKSKWNEKIARISWQFWWYLGNHLGTYRFPKIVGLNLIFGHWRFSIPKIMIAWCWKWGENCVLLVVPMFEYSNQWTAITRALLTARPPHFFFPLQHSAQFQNKSLIQAYQYLLLFSKHWPGWLGQWWGW